MAQDPRTGFFWQLRSTELRGVQCLIHEELRHDSGSQFLGKYQFGEGVPSWEGREKFVGRELS